MKGNAATLIAAIGAAGAALLGILALAGWALGLPVLTAVRAPYRPIAPSAACALIILGLLLAWLASGGAHRRGRAFVAVVTGFLSLYGLLELIGFLVGADLNREDVLTAYLTKAWSISFTPMSPAAGALMFLVGASLLALLLRSTAERADGARRLGDVAGGLGAVAVAVALVFVLSYLYGVPLLYRSQVVPIAATSALGFLFLGIGAVAAAGPAQWPLRALVGASARAQLLRTFVPLTVLVVVAVSVARELEPALVSLNRALESSLLAVAGALVAGLVAFRVAEVLGGAIDRAQVAQREAEERLRGSERRWATTLASIGDAVIATDVAGRVTFLNATAEKLTGWTVAEAAGRPVTEVFHITNESTRQEVESPVAKVLREGAVVGLANHTLLVRRDGGEVPIDDSGAPIQDEHGRTTGVVLVFHDITERRKAEAALRESEGRYRSLFENMLDGYAYCRMLYDGETPQDFVYLDVNSAFERLTGLKDVVGRRVSEVIPGIREANPELFATYGRVARSGRPERFEVYLDSLGMWLSIAVYSPGQEHFVAVFDNITARKRAEEAQQRLTEQLLTAERARAETAEQMAAEINHRMKNNFTLLSSVLGLQAMSLPQGSAGATALRDAITRLTSLSVVHEQLYEARSARVDLRAVLQRIAELDLQAVTSVAASLQVSGDETSISSKLGSTLALVANELITNALRHGSPGSSGRLEIEVLVSRRADGLRLRVWNSGNPVPESFDVSRQPGMGLSLVDGVVTAQLHGSFTLHAEREGTAAEIFIPEGEIKAAEFVPVGEGLTTPNV